MASKKGIGGWAGVRSRARPPQPPKGTARPGGMKRYGAHVRPVVVGGPGTPPSWFLTGNNSPEEWYIWWACRVVYKQKPGEGLWLYQTRIAPQLPGGIKPDFVHLQQPNVVQRVQSDRYHVQVNSWKAAYDIEQRLVLQQMRFIVIDTYPQYYMDDESGKKAILMVREAQNHIQRADPRYTRTSWARF